MTWAPNTELRTYVSEAIATAFDTTEGTPCAKLNTALHAIRIHLEFNGGTSGSWGHEKWTEFYKMVETQGHLVKSTWDGWEFQYEPAVDRVVRWILAEFPRYRYAEFQLVEGLRY